MSRFARTGGAALTVIFCLTSGCQRHPAAPSRVDAGAPRPSHSQQLPKPPPPPALPLVDADGCRSYWLLADAECNPPAAAQAWCDPVHERLTRSVLKAAGIGNGEATDPTVAEYLRGVLWNDDPSGALVNGADGTAWCRSYKAEQAKAKAGRPLTSLLGRSQFGDLQLLHGLATKADQTALDSYKKIIPWVEFTYRVGTGEIAGTTKLGSVPVEGLAALFPELKGRTVNELFGIQREGNVQARALGSLLHLLQDMLGEGHAQHTGLGTGPRPIAHYFTYAQGGNPEHRGEVGWRDVWADNTPLTRWATAELAVQRGIDVLRLASTRRPWPVAKKYLDDLAFSFVSFDARSVAWTPAAQAP